MVGARRGGAPGPREGSFPPRCPRPRRAPHATSSRPRTRTRAPPRRLVMTHPLPARAHLEHYRKAAKALIRALRSGDPAVAARARARAAVGYRGARPFTLADAQLVIAREHGEPSWPAFRRAVLAIATAAGDDGREGAAAGDDAAPSVLAAALAAARAGWGE